MQQPTKLRVLLLIAVAFVAGGIIGPQFQTAAETFASQNPSTALTSTSASKTSDQAVSPTPPANSSGMVWVNLGSRAYYKPGSRYYGKTKRGKYMLEDDAIRAGYHAASRK